MSRPDIEEPTLEEVRRQIEEALGMGSFPGWLDEACRRLELWRQMKGWSRIYDISTVGSRIRVARETVGLTQPQLADRMGVHPWTVSHWENGRMDLPAAKVPGLSKALKVRIPWLLMESDEGGPAMPKGIVRKQKRVNWNHLNNVTKARARAKAELERLRGVRGPYVPRESPKRAPDSPPNDPSEGQ